MNIELSGRHIDITAAIRQQVDERAEKLENRCNDALHIEVILEVQKLEHIAEVLLKTNGNKFIAKQTSEDLYNSINSAFDHIEAQVVKWRDKRQRGKRH